MNQLQGISKRLTWVGMCGARSLVTKTPGSLSLCSRYLEVDIPFGGRVRFSPALVSVSAGWLIPYMWSTVTVQHDLADYPNPIVFHPSWPCSVKRIAAALDHWGYTMPLKVSNDAGLSDYDNQEERIGRVVSPLTPFGEIEIDGRRFSALCVSGHVQSGLAEVIRNGNTSLLVREKICQRPPPLD